MNKKTNFKKIKPILVGFLISIIALPTIAFGGSFVSSLVQGKTVEEAVQTLTEQLNFLIGRVEVIEIAQIEQEQTISELQTIIDQQKAQIIEKEAYRKTEAERIAQEEAEKARIRAEQELQRQLEAQRLAGEQRQREIARQQELERQRQLEEQRQKEEWIAPVSAHASGYTVWGNTWYTGIPEFAIDGNFITSWTLNDMGEIIFDLGVIRRVKGIEAYWGGSVTNGNTINVFVDDIQVLHNEKFGATNNKRYFNPIRGRYIKYQTVSLPHNVLLQVATWSEISEFRVLIKSE